MQSAVFDDTFISYPAAVPIVDAAPYQWSVYLGRVDLARYDLPPALKIGIVGTGTVGQRLAEHARAYGSVELLDVWTLAIAAQRLDVISAWRLVEQYEARLQFARPLPILVLASGD